MKKIVGTLVLVVMLVTVLCVSAGCSTGNSDQQAEIDALRQSIESLVSENSDLSDRVEDLENKNNVFWTDKAEYGEHETMTIYYNKKAVYRIRLNFINGFAFDTVDTDGMNGAIYATSLVCDMRSDAVISTSYVEWDTGIATRDVSNSPFILRKNQEEPVYSIFSSDDNVTLGNSYDFVICVPGTPFELARFVNITMKK